MELADFHMPTYKWDMGVPIDKLRTGSHLCMLLYALDKLFYKSPFSEKGDQLQNRDIIFFLKYLVLYFHNKLLYLIM